MDEVTWGALTLTLTLLGAAYTWFAFRNRGVAAGLRGAAFTLLPPAAFLTDTLQMFTRILDAVGDWAVGLALRPTVWAGIILAGLAVVLFVVSGFLRNRGADASPKEPKRAKAAKQPDALNPSTASQTAVDDDLADIEAILKKRGIT